MKQPSLLNQIRGRVTRQLGISPEYLIPLDRQEVPKTAIGKIQRSALQRDFEAGKFQGTLRQMDLLLGAANTLPDWFYSPVWKRKQMRGLQHFESGNVTEPRLLVIGDTAQLRDLCGAFNRANAIYSSKGKDYDAVAAQLVGNATGSIHIVHARMLAERESANAVSDLLHLCQALYRANPLGRTCHLTVIWRGAQCVNADEAIDPDKSAVLGVLRTVPYELPWLRVKHIDVDQSATDALARILDSEIAERDAETEIAYRNGIRFAHRLEKVNFERLTAKPFIELEERGIYLITGGLGGIAELVAAYLLESKSARLILTGPSPLSGLSEEKQRRWERIQKLGDVIYASSELASDSLETVVRDAERKWSSQLSGIFHLAGIFEEKQLVDLDEGDLQRVLSPKVDGARAVHELARKRLGCSCIHFSSVNGFFGGSTVAAYAAANAFLDAFVSFQRRDGVRSQSLAWSMWEETGLSKHYEMRDLTRARGYQMIRPAQGIQSMLAAMKADASHVLVGLDGANPNLRALTDAPASNAYEVLAYVKPAQPEPRIPERVFLQDLFGRNLSVRVTVLQNAPLTAPGRLDREAVVALIEGRGTGTPEILAPRNSIEKTLLNIWREVLGRDRIGVEDNFFDLGGHSIRLAQVFTRIREQLPEASVTMVDLFRFPTIASLASHLSGVQPAPRDPGLARAEARRNASARLQTRAQARGK